MVARLFQSVRQKSNQVECLCTWGGTQQTDTHGEGEGGRRERRGTEKYKQYENE